MLKCHSSGVRFGACKFSGFSPKRIPEVVCFFFFLLFSFLQIQKQNYQHVHKFSTLLIVPDSQKSSVQIILQLVFHKQTEKSSSKCCKSRNLCYKKVFFHNDSKKKKLPRGPCSTAPREREGGNKGKVTRRRQILTAA